MPAVAKFVLSSVLSIGPGAEQPWPVYQPEEHEAAGLSVMVGLTPGKPGAQVICAEKPGTYSIGFHLGFMPLPDGAAPVDGFVELHHGAAPVMAATFRAAASQWTATNNVVLAVLSTASPCLRFSYFSTGRATVSSDPRVTYFTAHRVQ